MSPPDDSSWSPAPSVESAATGEMSARSRRSFLTGLIAAGAGYAGLHWLNTRPPADGVPWPLRKGLQFNESISRKLFDPGRHIAEMPAAALTAGGPRVNGDIGLDSPLDLAAWRLRIAGTSLALRVDDLRPLTEVAQITPLRCIEGWTTIARWTGVRLADFTDRFYPAGRRSAYVELSTPDGQYYVGLDAASALHAQTLLCYEINGQPLSNEHGAPLRLLIPTKYGIKNLKRVGTIRYTDERPADYWEKEGYDWFAGL